MDPGRKLPINARAKSKARRFEAAALSHMDSVYRSAVWPAEIHGAMLLCTLSVVRMLILGGL